MFLKELNIINFKNILSSSLKIGTRINCFVGDNGTGKTNFLDAIYYLSLCKSLTGASDRQNINHDQDFFLLEGVYSDTELGVNSYSCAFSKSSGKSIKKNDKAYSKISEHIGAVPVVTVTPRDNSLIDESGDSRRRYIDTFISQFDNLYLSSLIKYNGLIAQRNMILKDKGAKEQMDMIEIYDMQIEPLAEEIYAKRKETISELKPIVAKYYSLISAAAEEVDIEYSSQLNKKSIIELLKENLERDMILGYTSIGVSRDDLKLSIDGHPLKRFGSQGQQKSFLIAMKLAQYDLLTTKKGFKPILLLDDLFDRLDKSRVKHLMDITTDEKFGQIFITDCDRERIEQVLKEKEGEYTIYNIVNGEIK